MALDETLAKLEEFNKHGIELSSQGKFDEALKTHKEQTNIAEKALSEGVITNRDYKVQGLIGMAYAKRRQNPPQTEEALTLIAEALNIPSNTFYGTARALEEKALVFIYDNSKENEDRIKQLLDSLLCIKKSNFLYNKALENKENEVHNEDFVERIAHTDCITSTIYSARSVLEKNTERKKEYEESSIDYVKKGITILEEHGTKGFLIEDAYHTLGEILTPFAGSDEKRYEEAKSNFQKVQKLTEVPVVNAIIDFRLAKLEMEHKSDKETVKSHLGDYLYKISLLKSQGGVKETLKKDVFRIAEYVGGDTLDAVEKMYNK